MKNNSVSLIGTLTAFLVLGMMVQPRAIAQDGHIPMVTRTLGGVTTTNFDDTFESPGATNLPDNGTLPGTWTVTTGANSFIQNWNNTLSPNLDAYQGTQYVRLARAPGGNALLGGAFSPVSTGTLQMQFAIRMFNYTDFQSSVELDDGSFNLPNIRFSLTSRTNGSIQHYSPSVTNYVDTGITNVSTNDWQLWVINVDLNNNRYNLTVDNQTALNLPFFANGPSARLLFSTGNGGEFFVDAIPEPTMAALLGVGGFLLLRRSR